MTRISLLAPALLLGTLSACSSAEKKAPETAAAPAFHLTDEVMKELRIDTVKERPMLDELSLTGQIAPDEDHTAKIFPLVGGVVEKVDVELGDYVRQGQQLAIIRSGEIADLQNQGTAAGSDLAIARKNVDVAQDMFKAGLSSERDVLLARSELQKAQGTAGKSRKQLAIYGVTPDGKYSLKSPISGFITDKNVTTSMQFNNSNVENLFTVSDLDDVWILANVFQSDISKVQPGFTADVTTLAYPGRHFAGHIDKVFNILDPDSKVMKVRVKLRNPGYLLKPEMYAQIKVQNAAGGTMMAVPASAVVFDKDRTFVMVYKDRNHVETRPVTIASTVGDVSYVAKGLKDGERFISQNQLLIYDELND
ncbi:efflux RND transporter periplasmic adaptor subunit [Hymenobacter nivis]|uniref:Efflux RND transporter periplasmic adaptor subunit n=1 Tax=Hymenobacter nivis TaxID=1850093 RepID=A0A502GAL2_9BACT|nr:efflux RND transporter periplasmic adaptor subunit [Hymenobacter nivis]TPG58692.1 efflux RND transporter periplasmic adaptor subunit [Hymenobacter nivis]